MTFRNCVPPTIACAGIVASLTAALVLAADPTGFKDEAGTSLTVLTPAGKPIARYEYAHLTDAAGKPSFDTAKVYWHVLGPDGEPLTKGPGGLFPHHRGIFIGWSRIRHAGKSHDLWHVRNTSQKHVSFVEQTAGKDASTVAARIDWIGTEGKVVLRETRTFSVRYADAAAYATIDVVSELEPVDGEVSLGGDPEHAGIQFRPSQKVAENKSATYTYHKEGVNAAKDVDLPWIALTFDIDGQKWTVQHMSHPDNPDGSRWSAYRDYGRFGEFPVMKIADGETATLRYRFRVTIGDAPDREKLNDAYATYSE